MLTGTTTPGDEPHGSVAPLAPDTIALACEGEPASLSRQFTSSRRGARLARRLAVRCMEEWGHPPASDLSCTVALVVGELAANAVQHGRVTGRDFGLRRSLDTTAGLVRVEVTDAASTKRPPTALPTSCPEGESGRGLLLVDVVAARWGWAPRHPRGQDGMGGGAPRGIGPSLKARPVTRTSAIARRPGVHGDDALASRPALAVSMPLTRP